MRCLTAAQIKMHRKGKQPKELQEKPRQGSRVRYFYDLLMASKGVPVDLGISSKKKESGGDAARLQTLINCYGLDIRVAQYKHGSKPKLYVLAGEWFGSVYVDYIAEAMERKEADVKIELDAPTFDRVVTQPLARAFVSLPEGVHWLSSESEAALARAHAACDSAAAKFVKRGA